MTCLTAPFPYFGGKRRVAAEVWSRFGDVRSYVEPFFGSGAVLLGRPQPFKGVETVNDIDGLLCNFWRAVKADAETVARFADWPVSECDLHARHLWLVERRASITERLCVDPDWFDAQAAGWWVWGACISIPGNWLRSKGERAMPAFRRSGNESMLDKIRGVGDRMKGVGVLHGDWARCVASDSVLGACWYRPVGVFLDPPYGAETGRDMAVYGATDSGLVAADVRAWAVDAGMRSDLRIAVCGYGSEHSDLESAGWVRYEWSADGGMALIGNGAGRDNRHRETIWFSPACLGARQPALFGGVA